MNEKKLQTSIKDNKRQIIEQSGYIDEQYNSLVLKINNATTDLTNKINKVTMVPTSTVVDVSLTVNTASGKTYTAPFNGYFYISIGNSSSEGLFYLVNDTTGYLSSGVNLLANKTLLCYIPCKEGDSVKYFCSVKPANVWWARFIKGETV